MADCDHEMCRNYTTCAGGVRDERKRQHTVEEAIEALYWAFDARRNRVQMQQSERDAFKVAVREFIRGKPQFDPGAKLPDYKKPKKRRKRTPCHKPVLEEYIHRYLGRFPLKATALHEKVVADYGNIDVRVFLRILAEWRRDGKIDYVMFDCDGQQTYGYVATKKPQMPVNIIPAREEHIVVGDNPVTVYSHPSHIEKNTHIVRVISVGGETNAHEDTRGDALLALADYFEDLGKQLRKMAFEQEGAVRIPK